jgi:integrase/recombinase XerD
MPGGGRREGASASMADSASQIDRFIDALWIEDGLSAQTLAAYRRDLKLFGL